MPRKKSPPKDDILEETKPIKETEDVEEPLEKAVKPKKPRTPKQIEAFNKMLAAQNEKKKAKAAANKEDKNQTVELLKALEVIKENSNSEKVDKIKSNPKLVDDAKRTIKGRGRPKKTQEEKLAKKTIIKEKVIYMIPDKETGDYKEVKNAKPLSKRHLKKIEEEKEIQKKEEEIGKRIVRTKTGKEDKRSSKERTPAQIAHSKRLVEMMAKKRAEKKQTANKNMKDTIKQAVVEVVSKPIEAVKKELPNYKPPQKNINDQFKDFFG